MNTLPLLPLPRFSRLFLALSLLFFYLSVPHPSLLSFSLSSTSPISSISFSLLLSSLQVPSSFAFLLRFQVLPATDCTSVRLIFFARRGLRYRKDHQDVWPSFVSRPGKRKKKIQFSASAASCACVDAALPSAYLVCAFLSTSPALHHPFSPCARASV